MLGGQIRGSFALLLQRSEVYVEAYAPAVSQRTADGGRAGRALSFSLGFGDFAFCCPGDPHGGSFRSHWAPQRIIPCLEGRRLGVAQDRAGVAAGISLGKQMRSS